MSAYPLPAFVENSRSYFPVARIPAPAFTSKSRYGASGCKWACKLTYTMLSHKGPAPLTLHLLHCPLPASHG